MCRFLCCFLLCQINRAYTRWRYYLFFVFFFVIVWRFTKLVPSLFRSFVFQFTFRLLISMYGECVCVSACMRAYKYVYIYICACVYVTVCVCVELSLCACWLADWLVCSFDRLRSFVHFIHTIITPLYVLISHSHTPIFTTNAMSIYTYIHTCVHEFIWLYTFRVRHTHIHTQRERYMHP